MKENLEKPNEPRTYTTADLGVGTFDEGYGSDLQAAILTVGQRRYTCRDYTYEEEREYSERKRKWVYKKTHVLGNDDGSRYEGYGGYEYNLLECLIQFLMDIPCGSIIRAARGGETVMERLTDALAIGKPEWAEPSYYRHDRDPSVYWPKNYIDYKKRELCKRNMQKETDLTRSLSQI